MGGRAAGPGTGSENRARRGPSAAMGRRGLSVRMSQLPVIACVCPPNVCPTRSYHVRPRRRSVPSGRRGPPVGSTVATVPDKRNDSKQRRAARNRASRDALAARRDNAVATP
jgi:hypothetical protein